MKYCKLLSLLLIVLFWGCASVSKHTDSAPEWYLNPPPENDGSLYLTISTEGNTVEELEKNAGEEIYRAIIKWFGISNKDAERIDLLNFKNDLINFVKGENVAGLKLIEKQIDNNQNWVIYLLIELDKDQLIITKSKLQETLKAGAFSQLLIEDARQYISNGDIYNGILNYLKAALESSKSNNSSIVKTALSSALGHLDELQVVKLDSPTEIAVGENGVFSASIRHKDQNLAVNWNNIPIKVIFRDKKKGAVIGDRFAFLRTNEKGLITFVHPPPGFTGNGKVEIGLDLFRDLGSIEALEKGYSKEIQEFKQKAELLHVKFSFEINSSAPEIETGIFIIDSDFLRKPLDSINTAQGLYENLSDAGFNVSFLNIDRNRFLNLSEDELLRDLRYMVKPEIKRVIFGVARITDFDDSAGGFSIITEAEIKVVDLESGEILFNETINKRVQGGESQSTINTSFKELGKSFSLILIDKLP